MESHADNTLGAWPTFAPDILPHLGVEDDQGFWQVAINNIFRDADLLCRRTNRQSVIVARVGACSHWLRPHQSRWTADGGFAWPTGYGGTGFSRLGLPEFDWFVTRKWNCLTSCWEPEIGSLRSGFLVFRVTLPTRTTRHLQAAIHTVWTPGPPIAPQRQLLQLYGFRKKESLWRCTAYSGDERAYERMAEDLAWRECWV
jgi:hypothetical protein